MPLLEDDYNAMDGSYPSYDAVGRGIYQALRINPDCAFGESYARLLKEAYPHFLSELASHILMLEKKDVEVTYLDRKINYLKIFALIEPDNPQFPLEIGLTLLDKGLRLSALHLATTSLYRAEEFLRRALELSPDDVKTSHHLGEVSYLLGRYDDAALFWGGIISSLPAEEKEKLERRLQGVEQGATPRVPVVDYLEAIGVALDSHQRGEYEDAAAILQDVLDDAAFCEEFPLPEIWYVLGDCYKGLGMPRYAEDYFKEALRLNPDYAEAESALKNMYE
ncbi:MAG: hypothetical protein FD174_3716 [Geobacteraceae bacterium]|nr:MAG: hypothetical protein FD174_3716 [Geobacteraceae bacterium]